MEIRKQKDNVQRNNAHSINQNSCSNYFRKSDSFYEITSYSQKRTYYTSRKIRKSVSITDMQKSNSKQLYTEKSDLTFDFTVSTIDNSDSSDEWLPEQTFESLNQTKSTKRKISKPQVSLTDKQYEEIFNSVLYPEKSNSALLCTQKCDSTFDSTLSTVHNTIESSNNWVPEQTSKILNQTNCTNKKICKPKVSLTDKQYEEIFNAVIYPEYLSSEYSTSNLSISSLHSEDFIKNAICSTPEISKTTTYPSSTTLSSNESEKKKLQLHNKHPVYIQCDICSKLRKIKINSDDISSEWFCTMNPNSEYASCSAMQEPIPKFIGNDYTIGSIVWAKIDGFPWWPAMIDDCPNQEQYPKSITKSPNGYNVVYFGEIPARNWVPYKNLKAYNSYSDKNTKMKTRFKKLIVMAKKEAEAASLLDIKQRLAQYSFVTKWYKKFKQSQNKKKHSDTTTNKQKKVITKKKISGTKTTQNIIIKENNPLTKNKIHFSSKMKNKNVLKVMLTKINA